MRRDGNTGGNISFDNVLTAGVTTITEIDSENDPGYVSPNRFQLGSPPIYYDIKTTATFDGRATICLNYQPEDFAEGTTPQLLHYDVIKQQWTDITTSRDEANRVLCGGVSSLSPFVLGYGLPKLTEDGLDLTKLGLRQVMRKRHKDYWTLKASLSSSSSSQQDLLKEIDANGISFEVHHEEAGVEGDLVDKAVFKASECHLPHDKNNKAKKVKVINCKKTGKAHGFSTASIKDNGVRSKESYEIHAALHKRDFTTAVMGGTTSKKEKKTTKLQVSVLVPDEGSGGSLWQDDVSCQAKGQNNKVIRCA